MTNAKEFAFWLAYVLSLGLAIYWMMRWAI
jgi:hypothetical protein